MDAKGTRSGLCWFGATCLAVMAFILVLKAIAVSAGAGWSFQGFGLLVLAALSLAIMAVLMALAFRIERRPGGRV